MDDFFLLSGLDFTGASKGAIDEDIQSEIDRRLEELGSPVSSDDEGDWRERYGIFKDELGPNDGSRRELFASLAWESQGGSFREESKAVEDDDAVESSLFALTETGHVETTDADRQRSYHGDGSGATHSSEGSSSPKSLYRDATAKEGTDSPFVADGREEEAESDDEAFRRARERFFQVVEARTNEIRAFDDDVEEVNRMVQRVDDIYVEDLSEEEENASGLVDVPGGAIEASTSEKIGTAEVLHEKEADCISKEPDSVVVSEEVVCSLEKEEEIRKREEGEKEIPDDRSLSGSHEGTETSADSLVKIADEVVDAILKGKEQSEKERRRQRRKLFSSVTASVALSLSSTDGAVPLTSGEEQTSSAVIDDVATAEERRLLGAQERRRREEARAAERERKRKELEAEIERAKLEAEKQREEVMRRMEEQWKAAEERMKELERKRQEQHELLPSQLEYRERERLERKQQEEEAFAKAAAQAQEEKRQGEQRRMEREKSLAELSRKENERRKAMEERAAILRRNQAVYLLMRYARMTPIRREWAKTKPPGAAIGSFAKRWLCCQRLVDALRAAKTVNRIGRGYIGRRRASRVRNLRDRAAAALEIVRFTWMTVARRHFLSMMRAKGEKAAAKIILRFVRTLKERWQSREDNINRRRKRLEEEKSKQWLECCDGKTDPLLSFTENSEKLANSFRFSSWRGKIVDKTAFEIAQTSRPTGSFTGVVAPQQVLPSDKEMRGAIAAARASHASLASAKALDAIERQTRHLPVGRQNGFPVVDSLPPSADHLLRAGVQRKTTNLRTSSEEEDDEGVTDILVESAYQASITAVEDSANAQKSDKKGGKPYNTQPEKGVTQVGDDVAEANAEDDLDDAFGAGVSEVNAGALPVLSVSLEDLKTMKGVEKCGHLVHLNLNVNSITKITSVAQLSFLKSLSLKDNHISDVQQLKSCSRSLREVCLQCNRLQEIDGLNACYSLTSLDLRSNQIQSLKPLVSLSLLEHLDLQRNQVSKSDDLRSLKMLRHLDLGRNRLTSLDGVVGLPLLDTLLVQDNHITSLPSDFQLPLLRQLWMNGNNLVKLSKIVGCPSLEILQARDNSISHIERGCFASCFAIKTVDLSFNEIGVAREGEEKERAILRGALELVAMAPALTLKTVSVNDNPVSTSPLVVAHRLLLLCLFPFLSSIDNDDVSEGERNSAAESALLGLAGIRSALIVDETLPERVGGTGLPLMSLSSRLFLLQKAAVNESSGRITRERESLYTWRHLLREAALSRRSVNAPSQSRQSRLYGSLSQGLRHNGAEQDRLRRRLAPRLRMTKEQAQAEKAFQKEVMAKAEAKLEEQLGHPPKSRQEKRFALEVKALAWAEFERLKRDVGDRRRWELLHSQIQRAVLCEGWVKQERKGEQTADGIVEYFNTAKVEVSRGYLRRGAEATASSRKGSALKLSLWWKLIFPVYKETREKAALKVQKWARIALSKARHWHAIRHEAALQIQKVLRGWFTRSRLQKVKAWALVNDDEEDEFEEVDVDDFELDQDLQRPFQLRVPEGGPSLEELMGVQTSTLFDEIQNDVAEPEKLEKVIREAAKKATAPSQYQDFDEDGSEPLPQSTRRIHDEEEEIPEEVVAGCAGSSAFEHRVDENAAKDRKKKSKKGGKPKDEEAENLELVFKDPKTAEMYRKRQNRLKKIRQESQRKKELSFGTAGAAERKLKRFQKMTSGSGGMGTADEPLAEQERSFRERSEEEVAVNSSTAHSIKRGEPTTSHDGGGARSATLPPLPSKGHHRPGSASSEFSEVSQMSLSSGVRPAKDAAQRRRVGAWELGTNGPSSAGAASSSLSSPTHRESRRVIGSRESRTPRSSLFFPSSPDSSSHGEMALLDREAPPLPSQRPPSSSAGSRPPLPQKNNFFGSGSPSSSVALDGSAGPVLSGGALRVVRSLHQSNNLGRGTGKAHTR